MKKLTQLALLLALILGISSQANAALLIEPVVGYNINSGFDLEDNDATNEKLSFGSSGGAFGGRLGYQNLGFQLGLDYLRSSIDTDSNEFDGNITLNEFGGFVGFEFPVLVRAYAGYIFSATGDAELDNGDEFKLTGGSGIKVGVGFTGLPFIDINLEYRRGSFSEVEVDGTEDEANTDYQALMIGLSLPLAI